MCAILFCLYLGRPRQRRSKQAQEAMTTLHPELLDDCRSLCSQGFERATLQMRGNTGLPPSGQQYLGYIKLLSATADWV